MKRMPAVCMMILTLMMSSVVPAQAILGLSQCEKVKKQILSYERTETSLGKTIAPFGGQYARYFTISQNRSNYLKMKKFVNFELTYLRFAYNNSKCFTRSQNEFIEKSYKIAQSRQNDFDTTPYFLDAWQDGTLLYEYPYGGAQVSLYSK